MTALEDRAAWLAERRKGVGASDVAGIVGRSQWASPWSVWADKTGRVPPDAKDETPSMRLGRDLEPVIAKWFEEDTGLWVAGEQMVIRRPATPWFATVDGLVMDSEHGDELQWPAITDALGIFEAKYTGDPPWSEVPERYRLQCMWAMHCADLPRAWVAVMHLAFGRPAFRVHQLERDAAAEAELVDAVSRFWEDHVVAGIPPPPDATKATGDALAAAYPVPDDDVEYVDLEPYASTLAELRDLKDDKRRLDDAIAERENGLRAELGEATEGRILGRLVASWRAQERRDIDAKKVRAEHGDAYDVVKTYRVLRLHGGS